MIVDAHQHYWRLDRGDYAWLRPASGTLYRDFLPADLAPQLRSAGVDGTVLVQAAASEAETRYLVELAAATPTVLGVVGWVDMAASDAPARIDALRDGCGPVLKGLRPMIQDIADDQWVLSPRLDPAFAAIESAAMSFDALVHPRHLVPLRRRLERNPGLRVVVDHCGKPDIAAGEFDDWAREMRAIARGTGALCKLSGLVTQLGGDQPLDAMRPWVELVMEEFGAQRVLWGSDWPVLGLRSDYARWLGYTRSLLSGLDAADRDAVLGGNAIRFYHLPAEGRGQATAPGGA